MKLTSLDIQDMFGLIISNKKRKSECMVMSDNGLSKVGLSNIMYLLPQDKVEAQYLLKMVKSIQ